MRTLVGLIGLALATFAVCQPVRADLLDLTYHGLYGSINGAWFLELDEKSTGTGVYEAFLQLQDGNDGNIYEIGYNSDQGPTVDNPELGASGQHNHTILWNEVPLIFDPVGRNGEVIANGCFAEFRADINQNVNNYLSVDRFEIWVSQYSDLGVPGKYYANWTSLGNTTKLYDFAGASGLALNYALESGSGSGDVAAYIPFHLFDDWTRQTGISNPYVYIYSEYGGYTLAQTVHDKLGNLVVNSVWTPDDGFDEWGMNANGSHPYVPEPGTMALALLGVASMALLRRKRAA